LACHPECQQKAQEEVLEVVGHHQETEEIDANQATELRYLGRCIWESLRLFPPVPVLERDLQEDLWIGDKLVPAGTMVMVSPLVLHHRENVRNLVEKLHLNS
jgi:cytochrome P450